MTRLLGFEGTLNGALVSYGAAAIAVDDTHVRNAMSGLIAAIEKDTFESVTRFKQPLDLELNLDASPLVVLAVNRESAITEPLIPDTGRLGGHVATKREKPYAFYVFQDRDTFGQYCKDATWNVTDALLEGQVDEGDIQPLIRACLVLSPREPMLWALRIHWSQDKDVSKRSAQRVLEPAAYSSAERYLRAFAQSDNAEYVIKYVRGIAGSGGLDLQRAIVQLGALHGLHEKLIPEIKRRLPFIEDDGQVPEPRFQTLKAASAQLGFGIRGETLRERVIRYFELELIGEVVAGKVPAGLASDPVFRNELETLLSPPETLVQHQPLGAAELEPIEREPATEASETVVREDGVRVLGFVEGLKKRVRRAELRVATNHVITVSTEDDGYHGVPLDADVLKSRDGGMFKPTLFSLVRRLYSSGRVAWFMQRMRILEDGATSEVDGFPSSVVDRGMFQTDRRVLSVRGTTVTIEEIGDVTMLGSGLDSVTSWLSDVHRRVAAYELKSTDIQTTRWLPPVPMPQLSALRRIVRALGSLDREARISELVAWINDHFDTRVRINNTMREMRNHGDLFVIDEDGAALTDVGKRWFLAAASYDRADERGLPLFGRGS